jgi:hypothetical protein
VSNNVVVYTVKSFERRYRYRLVNRRISPFMSIPNISVVPVGGYHGVIYLLEGLRGMWSIETQKVSWVSWEVFGCDVKSSSVKFGKSVVTSQS